MAHTHHQIHVLTRVGSEAVGVLVVPAVPFALFWVVSCFEDDCFWSCCMRDEMTKPKK